MPSFKPMISKEDAIANLRHFFPEGSTMYCNLKHVSRSGMSRRISFHFIDGAEVRNASVWIAAALGMKCQDDHSLRVDGCGMDMGFHIVSVLSRVLYGGDYSISHRWL